MCVCVSVCVLVCVMKQGEGNMSEAFAMGADSEPRSRCTIIPPELLLIAPNPNSVLEIGAKSETCAESISSAFNPE